jgi:branched-chain amino acid transport system permease protein
MRWLKSLSWSKPAVVPIVMVAVVTALLSTTSTPLRSVAMTMVGTLVAVVGLYIFVGNSGVFSLGHMAFMAVGGYSASILGLPVKVKAYVLPDLPGALANIYLSPYLAIFVGGLIAAAFAAVISVPMMRMKVMVLPIATFALLVMVHQTTIGWRSVTNGMLTINSIPIKTTPWLAVGWAAVAILIALAFQTSRIGRRLRASREDEVAARAVGIGVLRERVVGWVLSGFVVGIAGGLVSFQLGVVYPDSFWVAMTLLTILMLVIGGMRSLGGAVIGTILISLLGEVLRRLEGGFSLGSLHVPGKPGVRELILAAILLAVLIRRRSGIMGGREFGLLPKRPKRTAPPADGPTVAAPE